MKKWNMKASLKTNRFKQGSYSAGLIALVIAIVLFVNLLAGQLPASATAIDMSKQKLYTLSEESKKVVRAVDSDITIYQIAKSGNEDSYIRKLLENYSALSEYITVKTLDSELSPGLITKYEASDLADDSLIVVSGEKYKKISYDDIYEADYTNYYYTGVEYNYDGEGEITSAINYVTTEDLPVLYTLTGHGEQDFSDVITTMIEKQNFEITELNLLSGEIPEECDVLAVVAPQSDCSEDEADKIITYLEKGGNVILIMNYSGTEKPNFEKVLEAYGLAMQEGYICEVDNNYYVENGYYLLPKIGTHEITESVSDNNLYIMVPVSQGIRQLEEIRSSLTITDLLTTTSKSYADSDYGADGSAIQSSKDENGPFAVAVAVEDAIDSLTSAKLVVFGSYYLFSDSITQRYTLGNIDLLTNSLKWMAGSETAVSIPVKSLSVTYNTVTSSEASFYTGIFCVILPVAILVIGFGVWFRRRKA